LSVPDPFSPGRHKHEVAQIDHHPHPLTHNENKILAIDRINEQTHSTQEAQPPEGDRDDRVAFFLRGNPLHEKPSREDPLTHETNHLPASGTRHRTTSQLLEFLAIKAF